MQKSGRLIRNDSPNPRSILGLQKNGRDADHRAVIRAENYAEHSAESFADLRAVACADVCAEKIAPVQKAVQTLVQKICKWKNLKSQRY